MSAAALQGVTYYCTEELSPRTVACISPSIKWLCSSAEVSINSSHSLSNQLLLMSPRPIHRVHTQPSIPVWICRTFPQWMRQNLTGCVCIDQTRLKLQLWRFAAAVAADSSQHLGTNTAAALHVLGRTRFSSTAKLF